MFPHPPQKITRFQLTPFVFVHQASITCQLTLTHQTLAILFSLTRNLSQVELPAAVRAPARKYDLWEQTCFEFFLKRPTQPEYLEFNLAPTGDWNVFYLKDYRNMVGAYPLIAALPLQSHKTATCFSLQTSVSLQTLKGIGDGDFLKGEWEVGCTAVIKNKTGHSEYWAIRHLGNQPDFHSGFVPW